jgi:hypothetical protein
VRGAVTPVRPFLAAALHRALRAPVLVITANNRDAERFRDEAAFWLPGTERALLFPSREILPFEPLSPSPGSPPCAWRRRAGRRLRTPAGRCAARGRAAVPDPRGKMLLRTSTCSAAAP